MASLQKRKRAKGTAWLVQFTLQGARKSVFLDSNYTQATANDVKNVIEKYVAAIESDTPVDRRTQSWLESASDDLKQRFAAAGLIKVKQQYTLCSLFELYMEKNQIRFTDKTAANTRGRFNQLTRYIDPNTLISSLSIIGLSEVFQKMLDEFSASTCTGVLSGMRACFNWAIRQELIQKSPFAGVKSFGYINREREHFVTIDEYEKIMQYCPQDVRTALCLYRIGGLRRTEAQILEWKNVDFDEKRIKVPSPKTKRYGKGYRIIPMFPEIDVELRKQDHYSERVLFSDEYHYYYAAIKRAVKKAGLPVWNKLLQNLRMSRAIEINRDFGWIPESEWLGHTQSVAQTHYLRVSQEDYKKAVAKMVAQKPDK